MMNGNARADAVFETIKAQQNFKLLTDDEAIATQMALRRVFSADLTYITQNAQVNAGTFNDPGGATVATTGGPAAQTGIVTSAQAIKGLGTVS
ncbi:MAG: hypothetical protein EOO40_02075 [Deltaproteobacteria bacterium]|nr:MAG: hypothetical protein EOO40_02075 [Deltaproteobacteria bacterium]